MEQDDLMAQVLEDLLNSPNSNRMLTDGLEKANLLPTPSTTPLGISLRETFNIGHGALHDPLDAIPSSSVAQDPLTTWAEENILVFEENELDTEELNTSEEIGLHQDVPAFANDDDDDDDIHMPSEMVQDNLGAEQDRLYAVPSGSVAEDPLMTWTKENNIVDENELDAEQLNTSEELELMPDVPTFANDNEDMNTHSEMEQEDNLGVEQAINVIVPSLSAVATEQVSGEAGAGTSALDVEVPKKGRASRGGRKPKMYERSDKDDAKVQRALQAKQYRDKKKIETAEALQAMQINNAELTAENIKLKEENGILKRKLAEKDALNKGQTVQLLKGIAAVQKECGCGDVIVSERLADARGAKLTKKEIREIVAEASLKNPEANFKFVLDLEEKNLSIEKIG